MAEIVHLHEHRQLKTPPTMIKIFDGKAIEVIDVDALSIAEQAKYFQGETAQRASPCAAILKLTRPE